MSRAPRLRPPMSLASDASPSLPPCPSPTPPRPLGAYSNSASRVEPRPETSPRRRRTLSSRRRASRSLRRSLTLAVCVTYSPSPVLIVAGQGADRQLRPAELIGAGDQPGGDDRKQGQAQGGCATRTLSVSLKTQSSRARTRWTRTTSTRTSRSMTARTSTRMTRRMVVRQMRAWTG